MSKGIRRKKSKAGKGAKGARVPKTNMAKRVKGATVIPMGVVGEVTDGTFEQVVERSNVPVLVDFWAPWCGPCKVVAPLLEAIAREKKGEIRIVKYNTEANSRVASELQVRSIPTLALFKDGEVVDVKVGAASRAALESWIDKSLNPRQGFFGRLFA